MNIRYVCPAWGMEHLRADQLLDRVVKAGFDGIEINLPDDRQQVDMFLSKLNQIRTGVRKDFVFIAQQVLPPAVETAGAYLHRMVERLRFLSSLAPDFINSHTGKDHFSFDDNCRIIGAAMSVASATGVPVFHETHRGRFSFHAAGMPAYLSRFPDMELVGDFSHWCAVSESLLEDQDHILEQIIPHVVHLHARIGFEHGPQVNDPFAPEWRAHVDVHTKWWQRVVDARRERNQHVMTVTPEFGPSPYMPRVPYTLEPLGDQWKINVGMKALLETRLVCETQTIL